MFSRSIHVEAKIKISFFYMAESYSIVCIYLLCLSSHHWWTLVLFPPSGYYEQCCYKHGIKISVQLPIFNSFGHIPRSQIAGSCVSSMFYHFEKMPNCFPQWLQHFIFPRAMHRVLISPHPHKHLFSVFFIIHICISQLSCHNKIPQTGWLTQ